MRDTTKVTLFGAGAGFLVGGVLGGASFGPLGSAVGSVLGLALGAFILGMVGVGVTRSQPATPVGESEEGPPEPVESRTGAAH